MEICFKNAKVSHLQIMSVESIQKFQETKFKEMLLMETVQKYP